MVLTVCCQVGFCAKENRAHEVTHLNVSEDLKMVVISRHCLEEEEGVLKYNLDVE